MILAAGFGSRVKELTHWRAKPALEVGTIPIIFLLLDKLYEAGIKDVFVNTHYRAQSLISLLESYDKPLRIHTLFESEILGTAGGLRNAMNKRGIKPRPLILLHGDIFCDIELKPLLNLNNFCTLVVAKNHMIEEYVRPVIVDRRGYITQLGSFYSQAGGVDEGFFTGIHVFSKEALELVMQSSAPDLVKEIYPQWLKDGRRINGCLVDCQYDDLGNIGRLFDANMAAFSSRAVLSMLKESGRFAEHQAGSLVGKNVSIPACVELTPPFIIGDDVTIAPGAKVGPRAILGHHVQVGEGTLVSNSVVLRGTKVGSLQKLNWCIALFGSRVQVGVDHQKT